MISKGPVPGTPVVVADWKGQEHVQENGAPSMSSSSSSSCSAGKDKGGGGGRGCDGRQVGEDDGGKTPSIEKEHVQAVYDTIAPHW